MSPKVNLSTLQPENPGLLKVHPEPRLLSNLQRRDFPRSTGEFPQESGTWTLLPEKVRPESFPTGSPMSVSHGFLQYLGAITILRRAAC